MHNRKLVTTSTLIGVVRNLFLFFMCLNHRAQCQDVVGYQGGTEEGVRVPPPVKVTASVIPVTKQSIAKERADVSALIRPTRHGLLRGILLRVSLNRTVSAFLGIPYATPPIGDLRFRPPKSPESWTGVKDAMRQPASCFQREDLFFADFKGAKEWAPRVSPSEDCLYLNVFVPEKHSSGRPRADRNTGREEENGGLSVIVWIHGGGFASGSSLPHKGGLSGGDHPWTADPRELAAEGNIDSAN